MINIRLYLGTNSNLQKNKATPSDQKICIIYFNFMDYEGVYPKKKYKYCIEKHVSNKEWNKIPSSKNFDFFLIFYATTVC